MKRCTFGALKGLTLEAMDGKIGQVEDLTLDERTWMVRHVVIRTGRRWNRREFLVPASTLHHIDWSRELIRTHWTRKAIRQALEMELTPPDDTEDDGLNQPTLLGFYPGGLGAFSLGFGGMGVFDYPTLPPSHRPDPEEPYALAWRQREPSPLPCPSAHLQFANEISGYALRARDGFTGILTDLIVDTAPGAWSIPALVAQIGNWFSSQKVLLQPEDVGGISWDEQCIDVALSRQEIRLCPRLSEAFETGDRFNAGLHGAFPRHLPEKG